MRLPGVFLSLFLLLVLVAVVGKGSDGERGGQGFALGAAALHNGKVAATTEDQGGDNTWAILVTTSTFWFNYRHAAGALGFYRTVRQLGVPDDRIVLMVAGPVACDPRNSRRGRVFINSDGMSEVYAGAVGSGPASAHASASTCGAGLPEIDYRGAAVTVDALLGV